MISRCSSGGRFINDHGGSVVLGGLFVVEVAMMLWVLELEIIKSSVTGQGELGCKRTWYSARTRRNVTAAVTQTRQENRGESEAEDEKKPRESKLATENTTVPPLCS
jgi:hypothetical protein